MKNLCTSITISGGLTIAHYLFIILPLSSYVGKYNLLFSISDLHAITTKYNSKVLQDLRQETASYLFASGVKPGDLFVQSQVRGHTELCFIFSCYISCQRLKGMQQFRMKSAQNSLTEPSTVGLLTYPLLMASDILLYDGDVWVGNDQKQHIELVCHLANKFNNQAGYKVFHPPKLIKSDFFNYRIRDLQQPEKKMSKSGKKTSGIIFLSDSEQEIRRKIQIAKTDSENQIYFDFDKKPGISNLILVYALIKKISITDAEKYLQEKCSHYVDLKTELSNVIVKLLKSLQLKAKKYQESYVKKLLQQGQKKAQLIVNKKLSQIQSFFGFDFGL